jgi:hypothetical protein
MQKICLATVLFLCLPFNAVHAQSAIERRVQIAAHQSSLGHKLARTICFVESGVNVRANAILMEQTRAEIEEGITSMMDGGGPHNLSPEEDWTTRTMYKGLKSNWKLMYASLLDYAQTGSIETNDLFELAVRAKSTEKMWTNILNRMERRLANPEDNSRQDLIRLAHSAGAQGTHLQNAGKLACLLHMDPSNERAPELQAELKQAIDQFDTSAFALTFSSSKQELIAPPTDLLQYENFQHWQHWASMRPVFINFSQDNGAADKEALRNLSFDIETMNVNLALTSEYYTDFLVAQAFSAAGFDFD